MVGPSIAVLPLIVLMLGVVGVVLLILGWRGRRVGDEPVCRGCGFELSGLEGQTTCPECGADAAAPGAVVRGHRRKRVGMLVAGGVLGVVFVTAAASLVASTQISITSQPTWALAWQARLGVVAAKTEAGREAVGAELMVRRRAGALSDAQLASLIDTALGVQADRGVGWTIAFPAVSAWGDLLGDAFAAGLLTPEQRTRCMESAVGGWQWHWSRRRQVGTAPSFQEPMPDEVRTLPRCDLLFVAEPVAVWLDGEVLELADVPVWPARGEPGAEEPLRHITAVSLSMQSTSTMRVASREVAKMIPNSPLPAGEHTMKVAWRVRGWMAPGGTSDTRGFLLQDVGRPDAVYELMHLYSISVIEDPAEVLTFVTDPARQPQFELPAWMRRTPGR